MAEEVIVFIRDGIVEGVFATSADTHVCIVDFDTVREWLTDFNLPIEDRYFLSWHAFISEVCLFIRKIEGKVSDKLLDTIWTTIYQLIYLCYDIGDDFMTQFERNKTALLEIIQKSEQELGDVT